MWANMYYPQNLRWLKGDLEHFTLQLSLQEGDVFTLEIALRTERSLIPYPVHLREHNRFAIGNHNRVLVLRNKAALVTYHRPAIRQSGGKGGAGGNECFNGYDRVLPEARII